MKQYFHNLWLFLKGFGRFDTMRFKPGWSATDWRWWLLYLFDYGSHVLTGAAVVSWSRWAYDHRKTNRLAAFLNRLLNHLDDNHGAEAGPALWGTTDCSRLVRALVCTPWALWLLWEVLL